MAGEPGRTRAAALPAGSSSVIAPVPSTVAVPGKPGGRVTVGPGLTVSVDWVVPISTCMGAGKPPVTGWPVRRVVGFCAGDRPKAAEVVLEGIAMKPASVEPPLTEICRRFAPSKAAVTRPFSGPVTCTAPPVMRRT